MAAQIFQSTLPRGERQQYRAKTNVSVKFQSTLPRGERPSHSPKGAKKEVISIHAPTRGATSAFRCMTSSNGYFNPRSHEGSDSPLSVAWLLLVNFNPRSHEGSDEDAAKAAEKLKISIHAPTRGATLLRTLLKAYPVHFNPRSHEGSDVSG